MKLSMWMIAERLVKYSCRTYITFGEPAISGVRFFSGNVSEFSFEHVYMGMASDVFSDPRYENTILLVHGHDLIFVTDQKIEVILNEILGAFDFYNKWEAKLWETSHLESPAQSIVDLSAELLQNPIRFAGTYGNVLAMSQEFGPDSVDERWRGLCETGYIPLFVAGHTKTTGSGAKVQAYTKRPQLYVFESTGGRYIAADIYADNEPVANLMIWEHTKPFTDSALQIVDVICRVLTSLAARQDNLSDIRSNASIFAGLLGGRETAAEKINRLAGQFEMPMQIVALRHTAGAMNMLVQGRLLSDLQQLDLHNLSLAYESDVISLISSSDLGAFLKHFSMVLELQYSAGLSLPFYELTDVPVRYNQAMFALERGKGQSGVFYCKDFAHDYLLEQLSKHSRASELAHPALEILERYDKSQKSQLYSTLYVYLRNERNLVATAKAMFIHRNTLVFRIKRIMEMVSADLDDPAERAYILLSYQMKIGSKQLDYR